jgi:hypothetical protein
VAANTETFELRLTAPRPSRQKLHGGSKRSKMQMHRRPPMGPLPDPPAPRTAGRLSLSDF